MRKNAKARRGISFGTVVMLALTALVIVGFCAIMPKLTGSIDVRINASELAVAIDRSISQIASVASVNSQDGTKKEPQPTILPPESLATAIPPSVPPKLSFTLCASGSIMLNSSVQKALTDDSGYQFPSLFESLGAAMNADLSIATLENNVIPTEKLSDANVPVELLTAIRQSGINTLSLGYFGTLDGGIAGLAATKQGMRAAGITPYGAYSSADERNKQVIVDVNGVSVALFSYQNELSAAGKKHTKKAEQDFAIASQQLPTISSDIINAKQAGAQVIVVSLCWGKSGASSTTNTQKELAQSIADAGADIILGTHTGTLQSVELLTARRGDEKYHPVLCAYSLGNLFTYDRDKRSGLASILLNAEVVYDTKTDTVAFDALTYTPTYSYRGKEDGKTRYRTLISNEAAPSASDVDKDQSSVMERCLKLVRDVMKNTSIAEK